MPFEPVSHDKTMNSKQNIKGVIRYDVRSNSMHKKGKYIPFHCSVSFRIAVKYEMAIPLRHSVIYLGGVGTENGMEIKNGSRTKKNAKRRIIYLFCYINLVINFS